MLNNEIRCKTIFTYNKQRKFHPNMPSYINLTVIQHNVSKYNIIFKYSRLFFFDSVYICVNDTQLL